MRTVAPLSAVAAVRPVADVAVDTNLWSPACLSAEERARYERLSRPENRAAFLAARALAARCVAVLVDDGVAHEATDLESTGVRFTQTCPECRRVGHGRPRVPGIPGMHVSWSHSRGHVAAVASWATCGIDVEEVRALPVPERAFAPRERAWLSTRKDPARAYLRLWTRKEALVKCGAVPLSALGATDLMDEEGRAPATLRDGFVLREQSVGDGIGSAVVALAVAAGPASDVTWC